CPISPSPAFLLLSVPLQTIAENSTLPNLLHQNSFLQAYKQLQYYLFHAQIFFQNNCLYLLVMRVGLGWRLPLLWHLFLKCTLISSSYGYVLPVHAGKENSQYLTCPGHRPMLHTINKFVMHVPLLLFAHSAQPKGFLIVC